jgi:hypothetical protein
VYVRQELSPLEGIVEAAQGSTIAIDEQVEDVALSLHIVRPFELHIEGTARGDTQYRLGYGDEEFPSSEFV